MFRIDAAEALKGKRITGGDCRVDACKRPLTQEGTGALNGGGGSGQGGGGGGDGDGAGGGARRNNIHPPDLRSPLPTHPPLPPDTNKKQELPPRARARVRGRPMGQSTKADKI